MIFITIGTDHHSFMRPFFWIDEAIENGIIKNEKIIAQTGFTEIHSKYIEAHNFLPFEEMLNYFKKARIIISHASSTALLVCNENKIPIVIPRRKHFHEHVDDHQYKFIQAIGKELPFNVVQTKVDFFKALQEKNENEINLNVLIKKRMEAQKKIHFIYERINLR